MRRCRVLDVGRSCSAADWTSRRINHGRTRRADGRVPGGCSLFADTTGIVAARIIETPACAAH